MKCETKIHKGYSEFERARKEGHGIKQLFGKHQYIFSSDKGKISLVYLMDPFMDDENYWEIYSLEGNLFEDVERFKSRILAEKRVAEILE